MEENLLYQEIRLPSLVCGNRVSCRIARSCCCCSVPGTGKLGCFCFNPIGSWITIGRSVGKCPR